MDEVQNPNSDPLFDLRNTARYLGIRNHRTISVWMSTKRFPQLTPTYIGRRVFFRKSVLENFIKLRTAS